MNKYEISQKYEDKPAKAFTKIKDFSILSSVLSTSDRIFTAKFQHKFPAFAAMVIGRNVANVTSIEDFLKSFHTDNEKINNWLDTTLRKFFIRDFTKTKPYNAKGSDPDWMQGKTDLVQVELDQDIRGKVEHVVDFLKSQMSQNPNMNLQSFQAEEAFKQSAAWLEQLLKKKIEEEVEGKDYEVILTEGSFKWIKLISENALSREGRLMGHCVGGYWKQVQGGAVEIYSLRDSKNEPHATIEYQPKRREINQIKGKQNKELKEEYRGTLITFLNSLKINWKDINKYDAGRNGLLLAGNKQVVDINNIPDGTVLVGPIKDYEGDINFPANATIAGDFVASKKQTSLPSNKLEVKGTLDISKADRKYVGTLPVEMVITKDFIASGTLVEKLPPKFRCGGSVFLDGCNLLSLPDNLYIKVEFDISNNPIKSLPKNLKVGGEFDLMDTEITELPADLQCGDAIYVDDESKMTIPEHLKEQVF